MHWIPQYESPVPSRGRDRACEIPEITKGAKALVRLADSGRYSTITESDKTVSLQKSPCPCGPVPDKVGVPNKVGVPLGAAAKPDPPPTHIESLEVDADGGGVRGVDPEAPYL